MNFKNKMLKALFFRQLIWCVFALALLVFALGISWQVSKTSSFLYGFWYQTLDIQQVINKSVPKNSQGKRDFPTDDSQLHEKKFADIVQAIHQHGDGLAEIRYVNLQGISRKLLTPSEVQHLQDVANLLDSISHYWWGNLFLLLSLLVFYCRKLKNYTALNARQSLIKSTRKLPTGKQKFLTLAGFVLCIAALLGILGFTEVFYYLHTVVFPANHQWFFYYNDSLMASLMKAPDIFAAIAMQLVVVALLIAAGVDLLLSHYQQKS